MPISENRFRRTSAAPVLACVVLGVLFAVGGFSFGAERIVRFEGLRSVGEDRALEWIGSQLQFVESAGVSPARADDLAFFLENAMRQEGYRDATVDWRVEGQGEGARIVLVVSEGSSMLLGTISVEGNEALEDEAVVELLTAATRKRLKRGPEDEIPFVREDLDRGRSGIVSFYSQLGYRDSSVEIEESAGAGAVDLAVSIDEGLRSRVRDVLLPEPPDPVLGGVLESIRGEFRNRVFSAEMKRNLTSRIRAAAVDGGYYHAKITSDPVEAGEGGGERVLDLLVEADWGEPVSVSQVRVGGNAKVRTEFFERHFSRIVDKPYSPTQANEAVHELLRTGAFETVRTEVAPLDGGDYAFDVAVEESPSRVLGIYGGFTNFEGPIGGFEFRQLNLFGLVRQLDAAIEFTQRGARGLIDYTDPWFLGTANQFSAGLFAVNRLERGYEKFRTGGRYELRRHFGQRKRDSIAFFGEAAYTDVHKAVIAPVFLGDRSYFTHQLGVSFTHDRRDDPARPRKGYIAQASVAAATSAFGSEIEYLRSTGRLGFYLPVAGNTLRFGARAGIISPIGDTDEIPIDLRFLTGGPFSVRSFQERALGPIDPTSGHPIGGAFHTDFTVEYEVPVGLVDGLSLVPFADAGNLIFDSSDASFDNMRYAVGLGLRYATPIGPLRAEYGYNPDRRQGEPQGTFHIGFGTGY